MRWFFLATGIFAVCVSICILVATLVSLFGSQRTTALNLYEVLFFAVLWPKCLLEFGLGGWLIVWAITNWHGNVNRMLLLRLLDAQQKEAKKDENVA
jgi:hypothetical protein